MTDYEVLDEPEISTKEKPRFKSRTPSDLMIVIGIIHILMGLFATYLFFDLIDSLIRVLIKTQGEVSVFILSKRIFLQSLPLLFGVTLVIGGFGLVRHKILGWKFALVSSVFAIALPLLKRMLNLFMPQIEWSVSGLFAFIFLLVFGSSFIFLISKTIRDFYQPRTKDYIFVGILVLLLSLNFLLTPFFI